MSAWTGGAADLHLNRDRDTPPGRSGPGLSSARSTRSVDSMGARPGAPRSPPRSVDSWGVRSAPKGPASTYRGGEPAAAAAALDATEGAVQAIASSSAGFLNRTVRQLGSERDALASVVQGLELHTHHLLLQAEVSHALPCPGSHTP